MYIVKVSFVGAVSIFGPYRSRREAEKALIAAGFEDVREKEGTPPFIQFTKKLRGFNSEREATIEQIWKEINL